MPLAHSDAARMASERRSPYDASITTNYGGCDDPCIKRQFLLSILDEALLIIDEDDTDRTLLP
jgi:hypothetical protein